jgi:hypothetical protein
MFDSPFEYCPACRAYVLLDQTQRQCAREHFCAAVPQCPLLRFFTGMEFREGRPEGTGGKHGHRAEMTQSDRHRAREASPTSRESEHSVNPGIAMNEVFTK